MCVFELDRYIRSESLLCTHASLIINLHLTLKLLLKEVWSADFWFILGEQLESRTGGYFFSSRIISVIIAVYCGLWNMSFYSEL